MDLCFQTLLIQTKLSYFLISLLQFQSHILSHCFQRIDVNTIPQFILKVSAADHLLLFLFQQPLSQGFLLLLPFRFGVLNEGLQHLVFLLQTLKLLIKQCCFSILGIVFSLEGVNVLFEEGNFFLVFNLRHLDSSLNLGVVNLLLNYNWSILQIQLKSLINLFCLFWLLCQNLQLLYVPQLNINILGVVSLCWLCFWGAGLLFLNEHCLHDLGLCYLLRGTNFVGYPLAVHCRHQNCLIDSQGAPVDIQNGRKESSDGQRQEGQVSKNLSNIYLKYLTKGSSMGITLAFFKPGEITMEQDERNAEAKGRMKQGSYVDKSDIQRNPCETEGQTSGKAAMQRSDKNQVIRNGIWVMLTKAQKLSTPFFFCTSFSSSLALFIRAMFLVIWAIRDFSLNLSMQGFSYFILSAAIWPLMLGQLNKRWSTSRCPLIGRRSRRLRQEGLTGSRA